MTPEEKALLNKTLELTQENNKILKSMQRSIRWQRAMSIIYWVFIVGSAIGAYYLIQPYIDAVSGAYDGVKSGFSGKPTGGGVNEILDLLN